MKEKRAQEPNIERKEKILMKNGAEFRKRNAEVP